MISNKTKETVWLLKENKHLSNTEISRRLSISRGKVIEILKQPKYKNEQLMDSIEEIEQEHNESLLKMLRNDDRPRQIVNKILDIINDDKQLETELKRGGFRNVVGAMKVVIDNNISLSRDKREEDKAQQERILNNNEVQNDNFENAIMDFVKEHRISPEELIEPDSLEELPVS